MRILVVDDEPQIQRFLKPALTAAGYEVVDAAHGTDAMRLLATSAPDVVALDLGADDYVEKPFGIGELIARVRTALRHKAQDAGAATKFETDGLVIDTL